MLSALHRSPDRAMFLSELVAALRDAPGLEARLDELSGSRLIVVDHSSPDPHLSGDFRIVAATDSPLGQTGPKAEEAARAAAETVWNRWLREFLLAHRCT